MLIKKLKSLYSFFMPAKKSAAAVAGSKKAILPFPEENNYIKTKTIVYRQSIANRVPENANADNDWWIN